MIDPYDYYLKIINQCINENNPSIDSFFSFCLKDNDLCDMYLKVFEELTGSETTANNIRSKIISSQEHPAEVNKEQQDLIRIFFKGFANHMLVQSMFVQDDLILASLLSAYQYPFNTLHTELTRYNVNLNKIITYVTSILREGYDDNLSEFFLFPAKEIFEQSDLSTTRKDLEELFRCKPTIEENFIKSTKRQVKQILSDLGLSQLTKNDLKKVSESATFEDIQQFCTLINDEVKKDKVSINYRDDEIHMIEQSLCRKNKSNVALVGEPGTGKTAIVKAFADKINKSKSDYLYNGYKIYSLDYCALQAGASFKGEIENRLRTIVNFIKSDPKAILFIDEMHQISTNDKQSSSISDLLKPDLASGKLKVIGATTLDEYTTDIEKDKALNRRFVKVLVTEPDEQTTIKILQKTIRLYEQYYNVKFSKEILTYIVKITNKFIFNRYQPDKSFDLVDSIGAKFKVQNQQAEVTIDDVNNEFIKISGITIDQLKTFDEQSFVHSLKQKIFDQNDVIQTITDSIIMADSGLSSLNSVWLAGCLSGPTNSGKSYIPKVLAENLHIPLIRYDMCEYTESHMIHKLFGAPPGYVGHDRANGGAILLSEIDKNPHCILLLDNIEKAHRSLIEHICKILETGTMTTPNNKVVSFKNVMIIFTTKTDKKRNTINFNQTTDSKQSSHGFTEFKKYLNFDCSLNSIKSLEPVIKKELSNLTSFVKNKGIKLNINKSLISALLKQSNDNVDELNNIIDKEIKLKLAKKLLSFKGKTLNLSLKNDKIELT